MKEFKIIIPDPEPTQVIKILADENIHQTIIKKLVTFNLFDVKTVAKSIYRGSSDTKIIELARKEKRIIITADKDFGELLELKYHKEKLGAILLRYNILNPQRIADDIIFTLPYIISEHNLINQGFIMVLSEGRVRIRIRDKNIRFPL